MFYIKGVLKNLQNSQENTCSRVSFFNYRPQGCNFIDEETLAQVFPCEFWETFKNTFLENTSGWLLLVHFGTLGLSLHFYSRDKKWKCGLHLSFRFFLLANLWYNLSHSHTFFYYWRFELSRGFPCICFRCRLA